MPIRFILVTLNAPLLGLLIACIAATVAALRLGLFAPGGRGGAAAQSSSEPRSMTAGRSSDPGGSGGGESALPMLVGAFAVYSSWMVIGALVASGTGLAGWMARAAAGGPDQPEPPPELVARTHLLVGLLSIPVAFAICRWMRRAAGRPLDTSVRRGVGEAGRGLLWSLVVLPIVFAVGIAAADLSRALGRPVDRTAHSMLKLIADDASEAGPRWMLIAVAVVAAPVLEEIIYRALLQRAAMTLTRSPWASVLATSVLFTAVHYGAIPPGSFWAAASLIFSLSVFLGLLFARTGSVITSIAVHAAFNAVSIVAAVRGW